MLEIERLCSGYGKLKVLQDITLSVREGEIVVIGELPVHKLGEGEERVARADLGDDVIREPVEHIVGENAVSGEFRGIGILAGDLWRFTGGEVTSDAGAAKGVVDRGGEADAAARLRVGNPVVAGMA